MNHKFTSDIFFKSYLRDNRHFADMINAGIFQGKQIIDPDKLRDFDSDTSFILDKGGEKILAIDRFRDKLKQIDMGGYVLILGIENQKSPCYHMAKRVLLYDSAVYDAMKKKKKPCLLMTLVVYLGKKRWYVKKSILDELAVPEKYRQGANNWSMDFLDMNRIDPSIFRNKDNRDLAKLIQMLYGWNGDKEAFANLNMTREVIITAASATNSFELLEELQSLEETMEGGKMMCEAVTKAINKAANELAREAAKKAARQAAKQAAKQGFAAGEKKGREAGERQGRKAGIAAGEKKALSRYANRKLKEKYGILSEELKKAISEQNVENLEMILDVLPNCQNEQDMMRILMN